MVRAKQHGAVPRLRQGIGKTEQITLRSSAAGVPAPDQADFHGSR